MKIDAVTETCNTAAAKIKNGRRTRPPADRDLTSVGKFGFISGNASGHCAGKRGILAGAARGPRLSISAGVPIPVWRYYSLRTSI
jgi:hypothetical protein